MTTPGLYTFQDAVQEMLDYMGCQQAGELEIRDAKRAIVQGYRDMANAHNWSAYYTHGRVQLRAPYSPGALVGNTAVSYPTFSYALSSGAYPYLMTMDAPPLGSGLAQAVWPSWAADAYIRVNNVLVRVDERIDDTRLTLLPPLALPGDLASGTPWNSFYQDTYVLPPDFRATDSAQYELNFGGMQYVHPNQWLQVNRFSDFTGEPRNYTVIGDPKYANRLTIRMFPYPSIAKTVDYLYQRIPRPLVLARYDAGTVATAAGSATITGTGTAWSSAMEGSVIRVSSNGQAPPTSAVGSNPPAYEGIVKHVVSATSIIVTGVAPTLTSSGVTHQVSDLVDVTNNSLLNVFLRACEMQLAIKRVYKDKPSARGLYQQALEDAQSADSVSFSMRSVGDAGRPHQRLARMPYDPAGGNVYDPGGN